MEYTILKEILTMYRFSNSVCDISIARKTTLICL